MTNSLPHPTASLRAALREHAPLLLAFLATRVAAAAAGLRFNLDLSWMFLDDVEALRQHLLQTIYYFHAFAPGMNLLTGLLLKLGPDHVPALATAVFWGFGGLLTACLFQALKVLGFARWSAALLALAFSLLPQTLFLENLYLYTYLCAGLLCCSAVLYHRAVVAPSAPRWFWFFFACALLGWLYTVFHLLWFGLMLLLALGAVALEWRPRSGRALRSVALGAAAPALLLFGLYAKNYFVFGVFGATSWGAANMTLATTQQMRPAERDRWIREGKLSAYAAINVYAPPSAYVDLLQKGLHYPWPGSNELVRPSVGQGNYNHGLFLEVNSARRKDVAYYLKTRPLDYLRRVFGKNLPSLFHSTTHWHPRDRRPGSPHHQHRAILGGYESVYDRLVHAWPVPGVGLYVLLPGFLLWAGWSAFARLRGSDPARRAAGALLGFCVLQILFVVSASSLFTSWETSRYRFTIEPCIWLVVAAALQAAQRRIMAQLENHRAARSPAADRAVN